MVALSSFKPLEKCTDEIRQNQIKAFHSWVEAFDHIYYFGDPAEEVRSLKTTFIPSKGRPTIRSLVHLGSTLGVWGAIINADIVISPKIREVEWRLSQLQCECGLSRRYDQESQTVIDNGLDFFCATPKAWSAVAKVIPEEFRIGQILWDTWLLGYFSREFRHKCADLTRAKFVFHPKHGDREDQNLANPPRDKYLNSFAWPQVSIV